MNSENTVVYNPNLIPPDALRWVMENAQNELTAYLCEVDFREMYGCDWPRMAEEQAKLCRAIAAAANTIASEPWLELAKQYEATISCR